MLSMNVRHATVADAEDICDVVNYHAERGKMLHVSLESVYGAIRAFHVARDDERLVGCVAVDVFWADLAEIRSLAVVEDYTGKGFGGTLVQSAIDDARELGIRRLFTLTYEKDFFERYGFTVVDRQALPEKVWRACISCPKVDACDEIAMILTIPDTPA